MTATDAKAFSAAMGALGEAYGESISELRALTYFDALSDLAIEDVLIAVRSLVRTSQFFPRPIAIREAVHGRPDDLTETAWLAWRHAARRIGGSASIVVADPVLAATLLAIFGSWPKACYADFSPEMWAAKRKEFDRVYHVFAGRGLTGRRYLPGLEEEQNNGLAAYTTIGYLEGLSARALTAREREHVAASSTRVLPSSFTRMIDAGDEARSQG